MLTIRNTFLNRAAPNRVKSFIVARWAPPCWILLFGVCSAADRPNILFLLADDLGYEMLGSYGGIDAKTPYLDQLAAEGMRFTRAYGSPVCTPTRMSLYTGLYPTNHNYTGVLPVHRGTREAVDFNNKFTTYAQLLRDSGYATSVTGKWQLATLEFHPDHIRDAGFDSWCVWQIWRDGAKTTRYWNPTFNHDGNIREDIVESFGPDVLADYVIGQMLDASKKDEPFCIQHNMLLPHEPIIETPAERKSGEPASLRRMITYLDSRVGQIVTAVDKLGIAENTCIIFLGDNGTDIQSTRKTTAGTVRGGKRTLDDGGTHLPLIVRWAGSVPAGVVADDLVDVTDFFPTFCEIAGVKISDETEMDGVSIAGRLLRGEPTGRAITVAGFQKQFSVFDGEWRLGSDGELIDARELPDETSEADTKRPDLQQYFPKP